MPLQAYAVFSTADEAQRALSSKDRAFIGERFVRILRVAHAEVRDWRFYASALALISADADRPADG